MNNFSTAKTWQYPRISVDIATSKCFFCRGNFFVAIATTPNLPWIQRQWKNPRYSDGDAIPATANLEKFHGTPSLYPCLVVAISTECRRCIHALPSLYPRHVVAISTVHRRYIHGCEIFKKIAVAISTAITVLKKK